jgi:hypothetical protein
LARFLEASGHWSLHCKQYGVPSFSDPVQSITISDRAWSSPFIINGRVESRRVGSRSRVVVRPRHVFVPAFQMPSVQPRTPSCKTMKYSKVSRTQVIHFYSVCCRLFLAWPRRLGRLPEWDSNNFPSFRPFRRSPEKQRKEHVACTCRASGPSSRPCPEYASPLQQRKYQAAEWSRPTSANISQHATPPHSARTQQRRGVDDTQTVGNRDIFRSVTCKVVDRTCSVSTPNNQRTQNEEHCPASSSYLTSSSKI